MDNSLLVSRQKTQTFVFRSPSKLEFPVSGTFSSIYSAEVLVFFLHGRYCYVLLGKKNSVKMGFRDTYLASLTYLLGY